ncbi:MAG: ribosome maturation factor RimM [Treponema sp.]
MDLIVTGHISGTFGVDGFVKVVSSSGEYDHFFELKRVYIVFCKHKLSRNKYKDGWFDVEDVKLVSSCALLKLKGIEALEDARFFVGGEVQVQREQACALLDNEFYACDLCLCMLVYEGVSVGKIENVVDTAGILLEVLKNDGKVCYVPFNDEFIGIVNIKEKSVELKKDWILE